MRTFESASRLLAMAICLAVSALAKNPYNESDRPAVKTDVAYAQDYRNGKRVARQDIRSAVMLQEWQEQQGDRRLYDDNYRRAPQPGGASTGGSLQNWQSMAREMGYQDGINDALKDFRTGHSYRPTKGDNYKSASRGYSSRFGSKDAYKQFYREGYANGYQRGYYNNPSGGRR